MLSVDRSTVYRWADAGALPAIRLGQRTVRFDSETLSRLLVEGSSGQLVGTPAPTKRQMRAMPGRVDRLRAAVSSRVPGRITASQE